MSLSKGRRCMRYVVGREVALSSLQPCTRCCGRACSVWRQLFYQWHHLRILRGKSLPSWQLCEGSMHTFRFKASISSAYFLTAPSSPFRGRLIFCTEQPRSRPLPHGSVAITQLWIAKSEVYKVIVVRKGAPPCLSGGLCMPSAAF